MRRVVPQDRWQGIELTSDGLTSAQAAIQQKLYGRNDILEVPPNRWLDLARDTAKDPMIWFLVLTGAVYALLGDIKESVVLFVSILPLLGMDAFLHRRTQASTEGLLSRLAATARVRRNRNYLEVPAAELVPGDVAIVRANDLVPADGLVISGHDFQVDESLLTGEAFPVKKEILRDLSINSPVEETHWLFAGTRLLTGDAELRVVFTGRETLYGEIVQSALLGSKERTPLQEAVSRLVTILAGAALLLCIVLAVVRFAQGYGWLDALVSAATLAVAALPEEFPVVFTFFLGVGVFRLAKRKALVRRAVSVENIGRVTIICSDKTGTMTEGKLTLAHLLPMSSVPERMLLNYAAWASRKESGDPLDIAILKKRGDVTTQEEVEVIETFPFTEDRRRETNFVKSKDKSIWAVVKGSPEVILTMTKMEASKKKWAEEETRRLASEGHKVIACARRPLDANSRSEPTEGYDFLGLLAFEDPVRKGVREAIEQCQQAGIRVLMVTGDHPSTALAVAREIGLGGENPRLIVGDELSTFLVRHPEGLKEIDVLARVSPSEKLRIVRSLKEAGEIVAVTGDGVNDVPALQAADIGIAMGEQGTRSAREVASIVLLDDNFANIVHAIAEGSQVFENLRLSFQYLLIIHIPFVLTAAFVPFAGYPLLYLPIHIVWLEAIIHPTALLVFQNLPSKNLLGLHAFHRRARFFSKQEWVSITSTGSLITALVIAAFLFALGPLRDISHARALALAVLTFSGAGVTISLSELQTKSAKVVVLGTLLLSIFLIQIPWLARMVHVTPLHANDWAIAVGAGIVAALFPRLLKFLPRPHGYRAV